MNELVKLTTGQALDEAVSQLSEATAARKCWSCGCLHNSLTAIEKALPEKERPASLSAAIRAAKDRLAPIRYDCLGCAVCYPPLAMNALNIEDEACPVETAAARAGWPPFAGNYKVNRYQASVAVCTLTDDRLLTAIATQPDRAISVVGSLQTENLGIERLILNVLSNPNIRFLIICGTDSKQAIGHLPGQSLLALAKAGIDDHGRIIGAPGKRPMVRNIDKRAVGHFRKTIEVIDMIGQSEPTAIIEAVRSCGKKNPGPAEPFSMSEFVKPVQGYVPQKMTLDPKGYFVVYADRARKILSLEHYNNDGTLNKVVEGTTAAELYIPAIELGLLSRLDHAAYLGKELAKAEHALKSDEAYVQDAAPEQPMGSCDSGCGCRSTGK